MLAPLSCVAFLLAGCGGSDGGGESETPTETKTVPATWSGPPQPAKDGTMPVDEFNAYAEGLPAAKRDLRSLAIEFVRPRRPYKVTLDTSRAGGSTVTLLRDNLEDDSVRAERYTLEIALVTGGKLLLGSARVDYKCQPMRGHQDFSPELCL
jgi:hypothetical protein